MSFLDGVLNVTIVLREDWVSEVRIASPRKNVAPVFIGRTPLEVVALAGNLFSLCPAAQSLAAQSAGEAAMGQLPDNVQLRQRGLRLLTERFGEMLRASVLDWPQHAPPDSESIAALREILPFLRELPDSARSQRAFGQVQQWAARLGLREYSRGESFFGRQWSEVAADEIHWLLRRSKADFLRAPDDGAVAKAMMDPRFSLKPELHGRCVETGSCARQGCEDFVPSLSGRLAARLKDMAATLDAIGALLQGGEAPAELLAAANKGPRQGFAVVDSARGRLYHAMRLDGGGRIADYRLVAPTEWNFHPDGPFARMLRGGKIGTGAQARRRVERLAFVFDPCVTVGVEILDEAHA
ncbi:nickel-dependent hydrogenase large subunit [Rhodoblastus sp.]|uniref:nickel-dependent hydrogenase large subunit n=1 Tax=Rhodoblastus sp. TaxID=1962975 RepID=UPI003F9A8524